MACEAPRRKIPLGLRGGPKGIRGSAAIPFGLAMLLILGAGAYFLLRAPVSGDVNGPDPTGITAEEDLTAAALEAPDGTDGRSDVGPNAPNTIGTIDVRQAGDYDGRRKIYEGTGTIAGEVSIAGGGEPDEWTVHIEASMVSRGRDHAEPRVIESEPGMLTFEARDIPMGAYRVYASAPGMRSRPTEVALHKLEGMEHLDGLNYVNISLHLRPMANIDGTVRSANGDPAEGVEVFLLPHGVQLEPPMDSVTDAAGVYRFDAVPQGPWLLHVGAKRNPPAPPKPLTVGTMRMELDDTQLPPLASFDILVVDEFARPFPNAAVTGYLRGTGSGSFRGTTDGLGHLILKHQPEGPWRIEAESKVDGFKGRLDFSAKASDEPAEHRIIIR